MALNPRGSFTLDLSLFGSLVQDINATDLPPGGSPDNSDCFYLPGGVFTRPAAKRILPADSLADTPTVVSVKEFPVASGDRLTVFLDSNGLLCFNDPLNPSAVTEIDHVTPGVQFKAENFDGKQWYAFYSYLQSAGFSDSPFVGVDVPRYYDGKSLWRVTSDAPGISPTFSNLYTAAANLVASDIHGSISIESVLSSGEQSGGTPPPAPSPSVLQAGTSNSQSPATTTTFTFPFPVVAGNSLLVAITTGFCNIVSVTDSQGNAYTQLEQAIGDGGFFNNYVYLASGLPGGPLTVTLTTTGITGLSFAAIACHEIVGLVTASSPLDGAASHPFPHTSTPGNTSLNTGTISTANASDWIFTFAFNNSVSLGAGNQRPPGGYTPASSETFTNQDGEFQIGTAYLSVSTTGSYSPNWTTATPTYVGSGITVGLKLNPPPPPPPPGPYWTELIYTCPSPVPTSWLGSSITVTGLVGTNASVANITGTIAAISGDTFTLNVTSSLFVSIGMLSSLGTGTVASSTGNYMIRQGNTVTAYLGSSIPASAFFEPGFWVSVINSDNTLINGPDWLITALARDTNGLVTVTINTQLTNLPVGTVLFVEPAVANLTGTATASVGVSTLTWSAGVKFDQTWVGQPISYAGNGYVVESVQSDTVLTLTTPIVSGSGSAFTVTINYFAPGYITVQQVVSAAGGSTTFTFASLNSTPLNISSGGIVYQTWSPQFGTYGNAAQITNVGFDPLNGWYLQFFQLGPDSFLNASADAGETPQARIQAQAAAGPRNGVVMFESQDGAITAPSVPVSLAVSGGTSLIQAQNIPIGPAGTAKRILAFTPAEGANYYYITPVTVPKVGASAAVIATGTVINDNVTTSEVIDFSDTQLVSGTQIDGPGNNLFNQVVLAPCLGVIEYQGRLGWWGEINNVKNLLNMGFDGGFTPPAGTLSVTNGSNIATYISGSQFLSGWLNSQISINGALYQIIFLDGSGHLTLSGNFTGTTGIYPFTTYSTAGVQPLGWDTSEGDGAGSLTGFPSESPYFGFSYIMPCGTNSLIQQGCATDAYGAPVLLPSTQYTARLLAWFNGDMPTGNLVVDVYSKSQNQILCSASIPISSMPANTNFGWVSAEFNAPTPATIPADAVLRYYLSNAVNGAAVFVDELEIIYTNQPVNSDQMRLSYLQNPFGYDAITGVLSVDPSEPLTGAFRQRGYLYILSDTSLFQSQNNGDGEPSTWDAIQYAASCGCSGPNAVDFAEDVAYWAGRYGGRAFVGDPTCKKITQELAPTWESINWTAQTTLWVKNDPVNRILYFGLPISSAAMPSVLLSMSYRLSDAAFNVPDPIHVSAYSGRLICTDLGRRWSPWQLPVNCADMCTRPLPNGLARTLVIGGGNGQAPGSAPGFGNLYTFDTFNYPPTNPASLVWDCTDDDYGQINSFYTTYFFFAPDVEQQPLLSLHRKLFNYLAVHATGVGSIKITPLIDALSKPQTPFRIVPLSLTDPGFDIEFHPITKGNRVAYKIQPVPAVSSIAAAMAVTHLIVSGRRDGVFPVRGSVFG